MNGFILLHRKIIDNPYYFSEPFTRSQAWVDLLLIANHKKGIFYKRGIRVEVQRGQIGYDSTTLAKRWQWSRGKVNRFLSELENDKQIVQQKTNITTLISICNYDIYQTSSTANSTTDSTASSTADGQQTDTNKEGLNNDKNDKIKIRGEIKISPPPTLNEVELFFKENQYYGGENFFMYYEASGWKDIGGRKIKNWKQKAISWFKPENKYNYSQPMYR